MRLDAANRSLTFCEDFGAQSAQGTVEAIDLGVVTAKVGVRVGENLIESVITRASVEELGIRLGSEVAALIKSTEVMLMVE